MEAILNELNEAVGIKGSMIMTKDGMLVTSKLGDELSESIVAAMASSIILTTRKSLASVGLHDFSRFLLQSSKGKIILVDAGVAFLVVLADVRIKLDVTTIDINRAAYRIQKRFET